MAEMTTPTRRRVRGSGPLPEPRRGRARAKTRMQERMAPGDGGEEFAVGVEGLVGGGIAEGAVVGGAEEEPEEDGDGAAGGDAEDVGVGEGVAEEGLEGDAGAGEGEADECGGEDAEESEFEDVFGGPAEVEGVGGGVAGADHHADVEEGEGEEEPADPEAGVGGGGEEGFHGGGLGGGGFGLWGWGGGCVFVDEFGEGLDLFGEVDGGHEGVAVGDEPDAVVPDGGDLEALPRVEAGVGGLVVGLVGGADEEDVGGEVDEGFVGDGGEEGADFGTEVVAAGEGDHLVQEGFGAGDGERGRAEDVEDFGFGLVFERVGEFIEFGVGGEDGAWASVSWWLILPRRATVFQRSSTVSRWMLVMVKCSEAARARRRAGIMGSSIWTRTSVGWRARSVS